MVKTPILDKFAGEAALAKLINKLKDKEIPDTYDEKLLSLNGHFTFGEVYHQAGYTMLANDWLDALVSWLANKTRILELCGGTGALAWALRQRDIYVTTTDNHVWDRHHWLSEGGCWVDDMIEVDALTAIKKYGNDVDVILICYPHPNEDCLIDEILKVTDEMDIPDIVYIGSPYPYLTPIAGVSNLYHDWCTDSFLNGKLGTITK